MAREKVARINLTILEVDRAMLKRIAEHRSANARAGAINMSEALSAIVRATYEQMVQAGTLTPDQSIDPALYTGWTERLTT